MGWNNIVFILVLFGCIILYEVIFHFPKNLRSTSIFKNIEVVFHISSSWVNIRLHAKHLCPRLFRTARIVHQKTYNSLFNTGYGGMNKKKWILISFRYRIILYVTIYFILIFKSDEENLHLMIHKAVRNISFEKLWTKLITVMMKTSCSILRLAVAISSEIILQEKPINAGETSEPRNSAGTKLM